MENELKTDGRINAALSFVRDGSVVADIGTDHGYIPIYLIKNGISPFAYASDVNGMPLDKARENARRYGVYEKMSFHCSDGLSFIDGGECVDALMPDDIVICGMGGELIADIVSRSAYAKKSGVRLIMQPMTMADKLRTYLAQDGFRTVGEKLAEVGGKIYTVICGEYDGRKRTVDGVNALLGEDNIRHGGELFERYARGVQKKLGKKIGGLVSGGHPAEKETELYNRIEEILTK